MCGQCGYRRIEARLRANHGAPGPSRRRRYQDRWPPPALSLDRIGIDVTRVRYRRNRRCGLPPRRRRDRRDRRRRHRCQRLHVHHGSDCIGDADAVFVAVPTNYDHETPTSKHEQPDGDRARSEQRRGDGLAAVRSGGDDRRSAHPRNDRRPRIDGSTGATQEQFTPSLAAASGFEAGQEFAVALSPVRFSWHAERGVSAADEARGSRGAGGGAVRCSAVRPGLRLGSYRRDPR